MIVTKQQQLEWLALNIDDFFGLDVVHMSTHFIGEKRMVIDSKYHVITREEWQQKRDKIQKQQDNSWHERGELPPVGSTVEKKYKSATIWTEIKIVAAGNQLVIFGYPDGDESVGEWSDYEFRPLRTERERAIDELNALIGDIEKYPTWRDAITAIVDAGYHK